MVDKHINRKKKDWDDDISVRRDIDSEDEEWSRLESSVGEKIDTADAMGVQDRSITFNQSNVVKTKEEEYREKSEDIKDGFGNTAQYLKFINAHLDKQKSKLDQLQQEKEKFEYEIATLKPEERKTKSDLDLLKYKEINRE